MTRRSLWCLALTLSCGGREPTVCEEYAAALGELFEGFGMARGDSSSLDNDCDASSGTVEELLYYRCLTEAIREVDFSVEDRPFDISRLTDATKACQPPPPRIMLDPL